MFKAITKRLFESCEIFHVLTRHTLALAHTRLPCSVQLTCSTTQHAAPLGSVRSAPTGFENLRDADPPHYLVTAVTHGITLTLNIKTERQAARGGKG